MSKCAQRPVPQPVDPALLGSGDNDVERHVPSPRSRSGTARKPGAARSVATMQFVPAAALLARVDGARSERDALSDASESSARTHDASVMVTTSRSSVVTRVDATRPCSHGPRPLAAGTLRG
jgi:hypothetical protein